MPAGTELATAYVTLTVDGSKVSNEVRRALGAVPQESARQGKKAGGMFGAALAAPVGTALAGIGIGALVKQSIDLEASFSKTMATLQASSGASSKEVDQLREKAMKLGADTSFSANEAADAMLELSKAGISTGDIMAGAADGTLLLATAGGTDLATAATIASNAMNTFNLQGKDMGSIAAALAGGANASSASVQSLGEALSQVGPGATNAGLSLQDTVGVLSAFDAAGIKGSDAGTSLKTMLTSLVPQTDAAKKAMADLGLQFTNADGSFKSITDVAQQLQDKLGPLSAAQRTAALQTIFGADASRAATVLMKEGAAGIGKYVKATKDQGAAQKMADAAMSGTAGSLEQLSGAFDTMKLAIGQAIAPFVQLGAGALTSTVLPALTAVFTWMGNNQSTVKALTVAVVSLVAAYMLFKTVRAVLQAVQVAQAAYAMTLGGMTVAQNANTAATNLGTAAARAQMLASRAAAAATATWNAALLAGAWAKATAGILAQRAATVANTVATGAARAAQAAWNALLLAGAWVKATAAIVAQTAATIAATAAQKAAALATKAWAAAQWLINAALIANPIGLIVIAIAAAVAAIIWFVTKTELGRKIFQVAWGAIKATAAAVAAFFTTTVPAAFQKVLGAITKVWSWVKAKWPLLLAILTGPIGLAVRAITKNWGQIRAGALALVAWFRTLPGRIVGALGSLASKVKSVHDKAINAARTVVVNGVTSIAASIGKLPGKIAALGGRMLAAGRGLLSDLMAGIARGASAAGGYVGDIAGRIAAGIRSAANSALGLPRTISLGGKLGIPKVGFTIPAFARGVINYAGGVALVGEEGPELVNLPAGADVIPARPTAAALAAPAATAPGSGTGVFISNWRDGLGYLHDVADAVVGGAALLDAQTARAGA